MFRSLNSIAWSAIHVVIWPRFLRYLLSYHE